MPDKQPTPKQLAARAASAERLRAMHARKKAEKATVNISLAADVPETSQPQEQPVAPFTSDKVTSAPTTSTAPLKEEQPNFDHMPNETVQKDQNDTTELIRLVIEMMKQNNGQVPTGASVQNGQLTGTVEKYALDPANYPDPSERLAAEPKLERFAFRYNYLLDYKVSMTRYQTIDKIWMSEPKFSLNLIAKMIDPATGDDTGGRYRLCTMVFFEDPEAAVTIANEQGLVVDNANERAFLNEMRYLRMRDWLLSAFYPEQVTTKKDTSERVINNRVVDFYTESNATGGVNVPFDKLTRFKV